MAIHGKGEAWTQKFLAHRWHGPFRVKKQVEEFAFKLELPDRSGYRFYPVVHISRLKEMTEQGARPTTKLVEGLRDTDRLDFDEEPLTEDSCIPDESSGRYEVEAKLGNATSRSTTIDRS